MAPASTISPATFLLALLVTLLGSVALAPHAAAGTPATTATQRAAAATAAHAQVGRPYARGGVGPTAFDCSGLVVASFAKAGVSLDARSSQQMRQLGRRIPRGSLRRGDLVYTWDRTFGHVGVYLGRGRYVHAPGRGRRVEVAAVPTGAGFITAVRP